MNNTKELQELRKVVESQKKDVAALIELRNSGFVDPKGYSLSGLTEYEDGRLVVTFDRANGLTPVLSEVRENPIEIRITIDPTTGVVGLSQEQRTALPPGSILYAINRSGSDLTLTVIEGEASCDLVMNKATAQQLVDLLNHDIQLLSEG